MKNNCSGLLKAFRVLRDIVEVYVPAICFGALFLMFLTQIFWRYVLKSPLGWTSELIQIIFVWFCYIGSLYSSRTKAHIRFTMITDLLPKKVDKTLELLGNLLVVVMFIMSVKPSLKWLLFMKIQQSSILDISMTLVFFPYLVFLAGGIIYSGVDVVENVLTLIGKLPETEEKASAAKEGEE